MPAVLACGLYGGQHVWGITPFRTVYQTQAWNDSGSPFTTAGTAMLAICLIPCCASAAEGALVIVTVQ